MTAVILSDPIVRDGAKDLAIAEMLRANQDNRWPSA
jgi:hypothetical protein